MRFWSSPPFPPSFPTLSIVDHSPCLDISFNQVQSMRAPFQRDGQRSSLLRGRFFRHFNFQSFDFRFQNALSAKCHALMHFLQATFLALPFRSKFSQCRSSSTACCLIFRTCSQEVLTEAMLTTPAIQGRGFCLRGGALRASALSFRC